MKMSARRMLVTLLIATASLAGTEYNTYSAEMPTKAPAFALPEGVEPFSWPPMPKPRVLPVGPVTGGLVTEGFQLTSRPEKYQVEVLEPIVLHIALKNTTNAELSFSQSGVPIRDFTTEVKNDRGQIMPLTRYGSEELKFGPFLISSEAKVKGGEVKQYQLFVNHIIDMTMSGTYFVTVRAILDQPENAATLVSNTVQIDVFPRGRMPKPAIAKTD